MSQFGALCLIWYSTVGNITPPPEGSYFPDFNAGVEWITSSGYFFGAGVSYSQSYAAQVEFDYEYARLSNGNLNLGNYGSFSRVNDSRTIQQLNPLLIVGYSF